MSEDKTPPEDQTTRTAESESGAIRRIGPYRLLQKVGEGGMGEVYLAEQEEPVRRRVALKLIKLGMDTKQVIARFEAERQALALMDHPNVARVIDAGATDQGSPYFAMEYVKGESITSYCDKHRLSTEERLELFMQVCEGVQHAHQKGIIHRDIKPSNVLVTIKDENPVPKIIDFGVAKATEQRLTEKTLFTRLGVLIGTPEYMSPEQAEMTGLDVDTRTDVYSLGVLLYELLVGALPFDPSELRRDGFDEIRRRIREEEPSKPSTRLSTLGDRSSESARNRRTDLASLARLLRGDLDWITLKALEKDRTRRYGSPEALASDVRRHLSHEPVVAGPQRLSYRLAKFAHRHKRSLIVVGAAVVVSGAVVIVLAGQALMLVSERERRYRYVESASSMLGSLDSRTDRERPIRFEVDLDLLAPLGSGTQNAATWFADFTRPGGPRLAEMQAAKDRFAQAGAQTPGFPILLPDDPLLLEAETWVDQAVMRFYPDVLTPEGLYRTEVPNLLMMMILARSWIDRGDSREDVDAALEDYRRAVRLGRLLRQDDVYVGTDGIGLYCMGHALEPMARRLREAGEDRLADQALLALASVTAERVTHARANKLIDIGPYLRWSWFGSQLELPEEKLDEIGRMATQHPDRRFRRLATDQLCVVYWIGDDDQKAGARDWMDQVAASGDPILAEDAECREDPFDADLIARPGT